MELVFEDPPEQFKVRNSRRESEIHEILEALRQHPGKWARLITIPGHTAKAQSSAIQRARYIRGGGFGTNGEFSAVSRSEGDKACVVYVRYDGKGPFYSENAPASSRPRRVRKILQEE